MSKTRIFIEPEKITSMIIIEDKDVLHKITAVLRINSGEIVQVFDGQGKEYDYKVTDFSKRQLQLSQQKLSQQQSKPEKTIILGFPLLKEEKLDFILQKCTELGVDEFFPFFCQRGILGKPSETKWRRWQAIIQEATRQSQRLWLPKLNCPASFDQLCAINADLKLFGDTRISGVSLNKRIHSLVDPSAKRIIIAVGPEGDFSLQEFDQLASAGFVSVNLGETILRVETAAMFAAGLIKYFL